MKGTKMLEWLKEILGDSYTEEIDKAVSQKIGTSFVSKEDYNAKNEAKKQLETQLAERDTQLEALKKVDAAGLSAQIETLQKENAAAAQQYEAQIASIRLDTAVNAALTGAKAKNTKAVKALLDMQNVKLDGDTLIGLNEQLEQVKADNGYLFDDAKPTPSFAGPTPGPQNTNTDISKMSYSQMEKYLADNPNAKID